MIEPRRLIPLGSIAPAPRCDCQRCAFYIDNPSAAEPVCSGRNTDCSYCGCPIGEGPGANPCADAQCSVRCGSRRDIDVWMTDVGGTLAFDDIPAPATLPDGMPLVVPVVDGVATALDERAEWPAYGIGLRRVFSPLTWDVKPLWREGTAHDALRVPAERRIVLVAYGKDPLVEAFWTQRHRLYEFLASKEFDVVLAPNYSLYGNQPRAEHLINFRRNLLVAKEMNDAGVPAIPNIYWYRKEDIDRYLAWMADVEPDAIAINLQTQRTDDDWRVMELPGLTYLAGEIAPAVRIFVNGTIRPDRLGTLIDLFGKDRLIFVAQSHVQEARHGKVIRPNGKVEHVFARPEDAFAESVRNTVSMIDALADGSLAYQGPAAPDWVRADEGDEDESDDGEEGDVDE